MKLRWTPQFKILVVLCLFMLWASINYQNNGAYFVLFLLVSLVVTSAFMAWVNVRQLQVTCQSEVEAFCGSELSLALHVENGGKRLMEALHVEIADWELLESTEEIETVGPGSAITHRLTIPAEQRGRYRVREITVSSCYPLGFWRSRKRFPVDVTMTVYPKPMGDQPWPEDTEPDEAHQDEFSSHSGDHFAGHRAYQPGESQRHIDWKAFSRGKGMLIKDYRGGGSGCVRFEMSAIARGSMEQKLSQLARWVVQAFRDNVDFVLALPDGQIGPARGKRHYQACLTALAVYGKPGDQG
ncbi:MAG: DUF58 domain-containing protein [Verrucomicrobiota bacterium]